MWIERLAGTAPRPVPPHVFRLEEDRLLYARLPGDGQLEVAELQEAGIEPDAIVEGPLGGSVRETAALRGALRNLLGKVTEPVTDASLVLPDSWIRLVFAEVDGLPRNAAARDEILRFKLRRLIPFRVEDLRLHDCPAPPLAGQQEAERHLLVFGMESVLQQMESIFGAAGVRLGQISNASLSLLAGVREAVEPLDLAAVVYAAGSEYSLTFLRHGEPVIHRFKMTAPDTPADVRFSQVGRDLRLTKKFIQDRLEEARLRRILLVAGHETDTWWRQQLQDAFGVPVTGLEELPRFAGAAGRGAPDLLGPMMGAACRAA